MPSRRSSITRVRTGGITSYWKLPDGIRNPYEAGSMPRANVEIRSIKTGWHEWGLSKSLLETPLEVHTTRLPRITADGEEVTTVWLNSVRLVIPDNVEETMDAMARVALNPEILHLYDRLQRTEQRRKYLKQFKADWAICLVPDVMGQDSAGWLVRFPRDGATPIAIRCNAENLWAALSALARWYECYAGMDEIPTTDLTKHVLHGVVEAGFDVFLLPAAIDGHTLARSRREQERPLFLAVPSKLGAEYQQTAGLRVANGNAHVVEYEEVFSHLFFPAVALGSEDQISRLFSSPAGNAAAATRLLTQLLGRSRDLGTVHVKRKESMGYANSRELVLHACAALTPLLDGERLKFVVYTRYDDCVCKPSDSLPPAKWLQARMNRLSVESGFNHAYGFALALADVPGHIIRVVASSGGSFQVMTKTHGNDDSMLSDSIDVSVTDVNDTALLARLRRLCADTVRHALAHIKARRALASMFLPKLRDEPELPLGPRRTSWPRSSA